MDFVLNKRTPFSLVFKHVTFITSCFSVGWVAIPPKISTPFSTFDAEWRRLGGGPEFGWSILRPVITILPVELSSLSLEMLIISGVSLTLFWGEVRPPYRMNSDWFSSSKSKVQEWFMQSQVAPSTCGGVW